jgi:hypothetical protein
MIMLAQRPVDLHRKPLFLQSKALYAPASGGRGGDMKRSYVTPFGLGAILVATPVAASPALIFGAVAVAAAVGVSATQQPYEAWQYTAKYGWVGGTRDDVSSVERPLDVKPGTPERIVSACRDALMKLAQPHDVASLDVVSGGKPNRVNGRNIAPLKVRAIYRVRGVHEVKRSEVRCEIDREGRVIQTS